MTYEYDDHEIKCLNYDGDYRPVEPHCLNCGYRPEECECDTFSPATYWDEEGEQWVEDEDEDESAIYPCPDCQYCGQPKTWKNTRYIKGKTFMNKDACVSCYEKSDDGYEWDEDEEKEEEQDEE